MNNTLSALAVFALIAILATLVRPIRADVAETTIEGPVRYVVDGDTVYIEGHKPAIRIWGINAPEKGESSYQAATNALSRLVSHKNVSCRFIETDRYGRSVSQCFLSDGRDLGAEMIRQGYAVEYCRYSKNYYGTC